MRKGKSWRDNREQFPSSVHSAMNKRKLICAYCKQKFKRNELELDHLIPISQGGSNKISNARWACIPCHASKSKDERIKGIRRSHKERKERERMKHSQYGVRQLDSIINKIRDED